MQTITRRKDGRFCVTITVNGRRKYVYGRTKEEVLEKAARVQEHVRLTGMIPDARKTVADLVAYVLEISKPRLKPKTWATYEYICREYILPALGRIPLSRLNASQIQAFYAKIEQRGRRLPSLLHATLSRLCKIGWRLGWLTQVPTEKVMRPVYKQPEKNVWSEEEIGRFIEATREDWLWPLFVFLATTGCRIGEALALRWEDIDWRRRAVTIKKNAVRVRGEWHIEKPKTKAGERTISLPDITITALKKQWAWQAEQRTKKEWQESGHVFTNLNGDMLNDNTIRKRFKRLTRELGLPEISIHGLRHSHASVLLAHGTDIATVSRRLGHANSAITLAVYTHFVRQDDEHVARLLEERLRA